MRSLAKQTGRQPAFWNDPVNRFFRNDFLDLLGRNMPDTMPSVNISEEKDKYKVELAAPGLKKEDMSIDVDGNMVTISAEKKSESTDGREGDNYSRREYNYSSFSRSFTLPENADTEAVKASYTDGILSLDIPKKRQAEGQGPKKISID